MGDRWMIQTQLGRRNLSPQQTAYLRGVCYRAERKRHGAEVGGRGNQHCQVVSPQNEDLPKTAQKLATQHNVSRATIERDAQYSEAIDAIAQQTGEDIKPYLGNATRRDLVAIALLSLPILVLH